MQQIRIATIDPSLRNIGVTIGVLYDVDPETHKFIRFYIESIVQISLTSHKSLTERYQSRAKVATDEIIAHIIDHVNVCGNMPLAVIVEEQKRFGSDKGIVSMDSNSIQKLYFMSGDLHREVVNSLKYCLNSVWVQDPNLWKGNAPDSVIRKRVFRFLTKCGYSVDIDMPSDATDSVGMFNKIATRVKLIGENITIRKAKIVWRKTDPILDMRIKVQEFLDETAND